MIITLSTDFGLSDPFTGAMKGVIKTICPQADIIDITHEIAPQDIYAGSIIWNNAYRFFPKATIHVAIVDPNVGSDQQSIVLKCSDMYFVCPNNGLLSHILMHERIDDAYIITNHKYMLPNISRTFHGRDIFAPVAAHIASGIDIKDIGIKTSDIILLPISKPVIDNHIITAHITYFDHYGNAWTDLDYNEFHAWQASQITAKVNGVTLTKISNSYSEAPVGDPLLIFASHNYLEIAVRNGDAHNKLSLSKGMTISIIRNK